MIHHALEIESRSKYGKLQQQQQSLFPPSGVGYSPEIWETKWENYKNGSSILTQVEKWSLNFNLIVVIIIPTWLVLTEILTKLTKKIITGVLRS